MEDNNDSLTVLDNATRMLAEISSVQDAVKLINLAEAAKYYAKKAELGLESQNYAASIKVRAQRKAGEILLQMKKAEASGSNQYQETSRPMSAPPTYQDLGIKYNDASNWQNMAKVPEEVIEDYIETTKTNDREVTTAGAVRTARGYYSDESVKNTPELPSDKYRVIYADPPWKYGNTMPDTMGVQDNHYPLMSIDQLCEMKIKDIAEDDAVLFIWVTSPILEESFQVIKAWGFKYKASFVWDKIKHVMGHYNSVRHEFLLVCTKGSCTPDVLKLFDSVVSIERTEHSEKPEYFREIIDTIYTNGRRIELFARRNTEGWGGYGNEA